jgi:molybdopterin converting factor subunit 1
VIRILLFAGLSEVVGSPEVTLPVGSEKVPIAFIRSALSERYPAIKDLLEQSMAAVNEEYAHNQTLVETSDLVAFIPPVSGG